ncbi:TPA: hypothetical protein ACF2XL_004644 [Escherichia coli]
MARKEYFEDSSGTKVYHSKPCNKCGGIVRYASNRNCVKCKQKANADREAQEYRNSMRDRNQAGLSVKESLIRYFKQGGSIDGAPRNMAEAYALWRTLKYQSGVIRVLKAMHKEKFELDHKYPIKPDESDPRAIRADDGVLLVGRHVAANLQVLRESENARKKNRIEAGSYSANQLCPLATAAIEHEGKTISGAKAFEMYQAQLAFELPGVREKTERKRVKRVAVKTQWEPPQREFETNLPFRKDWVKMCSEIESGRLLHETYGDLNQGEGLRYALCWDVIQRVERASSRDKQAVERSGEIELAQDWIEAVMFRGAGYYDVEPLYLELVDDIAEVWEWLGGKLGNDGVLYRTTSKKDKEIEISEIPEDEEMESQNKYYDQFQKMLPKSKWETMWTGLIKANSSWAEYQFEPCNIVAIYQWLGEDLMYSDIDSMKNHIRGKMKAGDDESLIDLLDESYTKDWRGLMGSVEKYFPVTGYPIHKGQAICIGEMVKGLEGLEGNATLEVANWRARIMDNLRALLDENLAYLND